MLPDPFAELIAKNRLCRQLRAVSFWLLCGVVLTTAIVGVTRGHEARLKDELFFSIPCTGALVVALFYLLVPWLVANQAQWLSNFWTRIDEAELFLDPTPQEWRDGSALLELAQKRFRAAAFKVLVARAHHGELSEEAKRAEAEMKKGYFICNFYGLIKELPKAAYDAAFAHARTQTIPPKPAEVKSGSV